MTNKIQAKLGLVIGDEFQTRLFESKHDIEGYLEEYIERHGEDALDDTDIVILNILGEPLNNGLGGSFRIEVEREPELGEVCEGVADEFEYRIEDTGRTFDDIDAVKDYLRELIEDGEYTIEEIKNFDIIQTMTNTISFDEAEEGDIEVTIQFDAEGTKLYRDYYGEQFVLASEVPEEEEVSGVPQLSKGALNNIVQKELHDADLVNVRRPTSEMTDREIDYEVTQLEQRIFELKLEMNKRTEAGACNLGRITLIKED